MVDYILGNIESKNVFQRVKENKRVFIETGTQHGNGIAWGLKHFDKVYSIEILDQWYLPACERFKGNDKVNLIKGDSGEVIGNILKEVNEPCFIYLDAHGDISDAGPNPLYRELNLIKEDLVKNHLIILDDIRRYGDMTDPNWSKIGMEKLHELLYNINNEYEIFEFKDMLVAALKEDLNVQWWEK